MGAFISSRLKKLSQQKPDVFIKLLNKHHVIVDLLNHAVKSSKHYEVNSQLEGLKEIISLVKAHNRSQSR